ncbi:sog2p [Saccharomyces arboricola H-6]|uniref:Sog2p n=1 Tax=Saccharomyces arboricola (strain H-6 / AS 2.3317 / CBS 10644) TaxID=1160507 RepID=J8PYM0_SACAR|nr:sog2p [Saccharomyces arboricola H-6]
MVASSSKRTLDPKEDHLPTDKTYTSSNSAIISELNVQEKSSSNGTTLKLIALNIKAITDEELSYIQSVERLSLRKNHLTSLPASFKRLSKLQYLDLHSNNFKEIPYVLTQCPQLEILDLSSNEIEAFPDEVSPFWQDNIRVLSLKDNNLSSIYDLKSITKLNKLSVLDLEDNNLPIEELEQVQNYTPFHAGITKEEYWAIAISRYLKDHPMQPVPEPKISRAAKRMGFINTNLPSGAMNDSSIISSMPIVNSSMNASITTGPFNSTSIISFGGSTVNIEPDSSATVNGTELYNHSKYNDYFKRLSILPEETSSDGHQKISHAELVLSCRKLLFSFTECQQAIRKIASFCKEKAVAVNVVSLLYSVRSHTDNLVEVLQQTENEDKSHDQALIKLCLTIITNFKQIITLLRKNFEIFFKEDDLCFIRMFYVTLMCAYTEMYNAWSFIKEDDQGISTTSKPPKKHSFSRHDTSSSITSGGGSSINTSNALCSGNVKLIPKTRSTRAPSTSALLSNSNILTGDTPIPNSSVIPLLSPNPNNGHMHGPILGHQNAVNSGSSQMNINEGKPPIPNDHLPRQQVLQHNKSASDSKKELTAHESKPHPVMNSSIINASNNTNTVISNSNTTPPPVNGNATSISSSTSVVETNIDIQLYQTLSTVVKMVSVVYNQLTSEISKIAIASTMGKQISTDSLAPKIRDLTETCRQAMDLSKQLNERLNILIPNDSNSEKYLTSLEKLKTWEIMNAFLKVIISILANTKIVMSDVPNLNELRPNLANLAKITKDVTVILDLSSYKAVSVSATSPE